AYQAGLPRVVARGGLDGPLPGPPGLDGAGKAAARTAAGARAAPRCLTEDAAGTADEPRGTRRWRRPGPLAVGKCWGNPLGRIRIAAREVEGEEGAMTSPIITEAVRALVDRRDLTRIEAAAAMEAIMSGGATNAQIAAFLTALRMKGETVEELIGFAQVMRQKAVNVRAHGADVVAQTGPDPEMLI